MIFSKGNAKIGKDTIITNMSPAMKCPSDKLGLCKMSKKCYAKKAEIQYHHVVPQHREKQMICWETESEEKIFNDIPIEERKFNIIIKIYINTHIIMII